jgi:hypothetical protein
MNKERSWIFQRMFFNDVLAECKERCTRTFLAFLWNVPCLNRKLQEPCSRHISSYGPDENSISSWAFLLVFIISFKEIIPGIISPQNSSTRIRT